MTDFRGVSRVWATRPEAQNASWIEMLSKAGFVVEDASLLSIEPVSDPDSVQAVKNLILDFDQFQKVIFVSQNAVAEAFSWLEGYWPQLPIGIEYFAVGEKTAQSIKAHQVEVVAGSIAMNSDELLSLPQLQDVWGQKILICRGQGGLPKLGEVLHERGAIVRYCELYKRCIPAEAAERVNIVLGSMRSDVQEIVPLFSGETLSNFCSVLATLGLQQVKESVILVVPGKRVVHMAEEAGFNQIHMAANASAREMLKEVKLAHENAL